jgi:hypothetical protein
MTAKASRSVYRAFTLPKAFRSSDEWVTAQARHFSQMQ